MDSLQVSLPAQPAHRYPIYVGKGALDLLPEVIQRLSPVPSGVAIIADEAVADVAEDRILPLLSSRPLFIKLPSGEPTKSLDHLPHVLSSLAGARLDRHALILALGGGVIGDLAGFIAAIYLRGIRYIQIPTTLLAMVDSSVGGKTGVNLPEGKNLVGAFYQPTAVLAELELLETLPPREYHAGFAEIIKYGIIADAALFESIASGSPNDLAPIIARSIEIKAQIVAEDEHETKGRRALLNFGHTAGHAIEAITRYHTYLHGEAIALGMRVATRLSRLTLGLSEEDERRILNALAAHQLPLQDPTLDLHALMDRLPNDKKAQGGRVRWILTRAIGQAEIVETINPHHLKEALETLHQPPSLK